MNECARGSHVRAIVTPEFGTRMADTGYAATSNVGLGDHASIKKLIGRRHLTTCHAGKAFLGASIVNLEELFVCMKISPIFRRRVALTI
jgi:hypothetical protein